VTLEDQIGGFETNFGVLHLNTLGPNSLCLDPQEERDKAMQELEAEQQLCYILQSQVSKSYEP
jgi:hypothetical protein